MNDETAIPCLPCVSLIETLDFYGALGFEVTYQQKSPNPYAATKRGGLDLHFFGLKELKPEANYSTCCLIVPEVQPLHEMFAAALRQKHGKLPIAGFPRITRFKAGQGRFTLTDPNGNSVIWIKRSAHEGESHEKLTGMAKALAVVAQLRDSHCDDHKAAKALDVALERYTDAPPLDRARALAARAELAVALGETDRLQAVRAELQNVPLSDEDREKYRHELQAADMLERDRR
jgi:hypothetical protein